jgi:hypothetical protein
MDFIIKKPEVVSKFQIMFESKAQADEKAQHTLKYVSILKRSATQLSDIRWDFETTSNASSTELAKPIAYPMREANYYNGD